MAIFIAFAKILIFNELIFNKEVKIRVLNTKNSFGKVFSFPNDRRILRDFFQAVKTIYNFILNIEKNIEGKDENGKRIIDQL